MPSDPPRLAHNVLLNVAAQTVPLVVGALVAPAVVRGLGTETFGLLSLGLVVLGYLSFLDLGLGRTMTRFVASASAKGQPEQIPTVLRTVLLMQVLLGGGAGVALTLLTPLLVGHVFTIPPSHAGDARALFHILALSLPISFVGMTLRGALEGTQAFGRVNAVQIPSSVAMLLIPLAGLYMGLTLTQILLMILVVRIVTVGVYLALAMRAFRPVRAIRMGSLGPLRSLLAFGGWLTVLNALAPAIMYLDRLLIGTMLPITMLAYYVAAYEIATRMWILPGGMVTAFFPAMSSMQAAGDAARLRSIFGRSVKYLFLMATPLALGCILFADVILSVWLGPEFARHGATALRILGVGVLFNSLGWVPYAVFIGLGRPDIQAKIIVLELPVYASLIRLLGVKLGISGVAIAWSIQGTIYSLLAFAAAWKVFALSPRLLIENGFLRSLAGFVLFAAVSLAAVRAEASFLVRLALLAGLICALAITAWTYIFDSRDREVVRGILSPIRLARTPTRA